MISFTVVGTPKPQGSKRAYLNRATNKPILTESAGQPLKDWRTDVQNAAIAAMDETEPLDGPIIIWIHFTLQRPKSHPKTKETHPVTRPDIDKLIRAVLDATTFVCFYDDSQITHLTASKSWGTPGVAVTVARWSNEL